MPKIFFATDLHGSETCWRKFINAAKFYDCDTLICGGDMTGKAIVPIVQEDGRFTYALGGEEQTVAREQLAEVEAHVRRKGYYPLQMTVDRLHELDQNPAERARTFQQVMLDGVERWMNMAAEKLAGTRVRCFVSPGNDDEFEVDDVIRQAKAVELVEDRVVEPDAVEDTSRGVGGEAHRAHRLHGEAAPRPDPRHLQPSLPALPVRARRGAGDRRRPQAPAWRSRAAAGGLDRGEGSDPALPARPLAARPHPREQGRGEDRQDALDQSGQRLRGGDAHVRAGQPRRQEGHQELPAGQRLVRD